MYYNTHFVNKLFFLYFRVDINSTESLFGVDRILNSGSSHLKKYCDCATEIGPNEQSISDHYTANCSIATSAILCSQITPSDSLTSTCKSYMYQGRFRRDVNFINDDSDDVSEILPLKLDPSFDPNYIPPVIN